MSLRNKMNGTRGVLLKNTLMLYILQFSTYFFSFIVVPYETRVLGPVIFGLVGAATAAKAENDTELAERLRETVDERSAPTEAGYIETIGVGLYTAEDGMYYMYFVGHVPD